MQKSRFICLAFGVILFGLGPLCMGAENEWELVDIPEVWKKPPAGRGGYSWYRCLVHVPESWEGRELTVFVEPVDDARQIYINGERVGAAGSFPPQFRSGLGVTDRHSVDGSLIRFGELNRLSVRIYNNDGRTGFNVAAPVLFGGDEAIRCEGSWQFRPGDDLQWAEWDASDSPVDDVVYRQVQPKAEVEEILRRLPGEAGPLSVAEAMEQFEVSEDLVIEPVLTEPEIGQPLFIDFDQRGRMWVMNYQQYPDPAGLKAISRDRHLRTVYDKVPPPPPDHFRGRDNITIHEDTDGDGTFDKHKTFVDGLNIASSFAVGRGGVFVLNPPYLLFYPDADQDDVPDGDPEVLLEGFGIEDSHSVANNLRWGPDGWLYAAQGSTVTGQVKRYGSDEEPVHSMGQLIWRYHPETRRYEVFAEGGGNAFGVEIDSKGRIFSGHNGGDTRGFHYVQGGYYRKGFGKHGELSNPYAFGYFHSIEHHSVPRFTHDFIIYEGAALPSQYAGRLFAVGPLQSHVLYSDIQPHGASFKTEDLGKALTSEDPWFRPVQIKAGPDGAIYVCDFHEQRIDHASHYQGRVTPETGRIYRLRAADATPAEQFDFDYDRLSTPELIQLLREDNKLHRQIALRLLGDRRDESAIEPLVTMLKEETGQPALEALWALNLSGGFDESVARWTLQHDDPFVRMWTVRLLCDDFEVSDSTAEQLAELAKTEPNVEARCQLGCSARRLPAEQALPIVQQLLQREEDVDDVFMPLVLWWALESKAGSDREAVVELFREATLWNEPLVEQHILERLMRRYALAGGRRDLLACADLLQNAPSKEHARQLMEGFEAAYAGRTLSRMPEELVDAMAEVGGGSLALRLRRGDEEAIAEALKLIQDPQADSEQRIEYIEVLGQISEPRCVPVLLELASKSDSEAVRSAALAALQAYDDPEIGRRVVQLHNELDGDALSVAQSLLASRHSWALQMLQAVDAGRISPEAIPQAVLEKLLFYEDEKLERLVSKHWDDVQSSTSEAMRTEVQQLIAEIDSSSGNPYHGKQLFQEHCGKCHVLFGEGGKIGPDLTSYKRDDLRGMLMNIVNPSLEIREGFENFVVFTADGRTVNGFVEDQDNRVVVLKGADGQNLIIPRDEIELMQAVPRSIMPDGTLKPLSSQELRDLFAYLRATQPLP